MCAMRTLLSATCTNSTPKGNVEKFRNAFWLRFLFLFFSFHLLHDIVFCAFFESRSSISNKWEIQQQQQHQTEKTRRETNRNEYRIVREWRRYPLLHVWVWDCCCCCVKAKRFVMELLYFVGKIHILAFFTMIMAPSRMHTLFHHFQMDFMRLPLPLLFVTLFCVHFRCKRTCLHCSITASEWASKSERERDSFLRTHALWMMMMLPPTLLLLLLLLAFRPHLIINALEETSNRPGKFLIATSDYCCCCCWRWHWH